MVRRTFRWLSEISRRRAALLGAGAGVAAVLVISLFTAYLDHDGVTRAATRADGASATATAGHAGRPAVLATIPQSSSSRAVPDSFLGLSTEYWSLPGYTAHLSEFGRVLSLLHVPGNGPLILRVGGNSADHTIWEPTLRTMPSWVFELTPEWLEAARLVVSHLSARLIFDLNLITDSPLRAADWARAAEADLPRRSIVGFEVGNEPDIYSRSFWIAALSRRGLDPAILPRALTPRGYVADFHSYARLLQRIAPGVPLLGPAIANPVHHASWVSTLVSGTRSQLGIVTAHRYPYTACAAPISPNYPTIGRILSERASAGLARSLEPVVRDAHRAGLPFRLTELNSVTCGGVPGISNSFATALWAPDAMFELLHNGVEGVNVHVRTDAINAAFAFTRRGLVARPLLYGLTLFRRTLGQDARLEPVAVSARRSTHVKVWAVQVAGGRLHVLVINKGDRAATVALRVAQSGPATVERMLAPSVGSTSGVTLGGQWLGADGRWHGRQTHIVLEPVDGRYEFTIPRFSAALVGVGGTLAYANERARPQRAARPDSVRLDARHRTARGHAGAGRLAA
jgi:hypothetical protein